MKESLTLFSLVRPKERIRNCWYKLANLSALTGESVADGIAGLIFNDYLMLPEVTQKELRNFSHGDIGREYESMLTAFWALQL